MVKTIVVDVDGTIFEYDKYVFGKFGKPRKEVIEFLNNLVMKKPTVQIHIQTTRSWAELEVLEKALKRANVPYDLISMGGKCMGMAYLDDRAVNIHSDNWVDRTIKLLKIEKEWGNIDESG